MCVCVYLCICMYITWWMWLCMMCMCVCICVYDFACTYVEVRGQFYRVSYFPPLCGSAGYQIQILPDLYSRCLSCWATLPVLAFYPLYWVGLFLQWYSSEVLPILYKWPHIVHICLGVVVLHYNITIVNRLSKTEEEVSKEHSCTTISFHLWFLVWLPRMVGYKLWEEINFSFSRWFCSQCFITAKETSLRQSCCAWAKRWR